MLKIGVTGGIGSGKTTVCSIFAGLGVPVLFADDIAKQLSQSDPVLHAELTELLGASAYSVDGTLNRPFIAALLFSNRRLRQQVEAAIHPRVEEEIERRAVELQKNGQNLVLVEAALIYEAGLHKKLDGVIVVDTDEAVRLRRARQRDGASRAAVQMRSSAQLDARKKVAKADYVLWNNNSLKALETNVHFLYSILIALADEKRRG